MPAPNHPWAFVRAFVGLAVGALLAMAAVNVVIDPFWRFDLISIHGLNQHRWEFANQVRLGKAGVVCRVQPTTVILGTSRVEVGIDPTHPALREVPGPVYNMAMAGAGLHEVDLTLRHTVHASPGLRRVLLGLDFLMFNAHREAVVFGTEVIDFDEDRLMVSPSDSCWRSLVHDADFLLGPKALAFSVQTIRDEAIEPTTPMLSRWISHYDRNGFRDQFDALGSVVVPVSGYRGLFGEEQEEYYLKRVWRPPPEQRFCLERQGEPSTLETFRGIVQFARESGTDLRIFINPVHARMLLALRDAGLWPLYEDWKKGLVDVLAAEAAASGRPQFALWDFSGFNEVTIEHVPAAGDTTTRLKGFWEPSHYKKDVGDRMLDIMLGPRDAEHAVSDDFGESLTPDTIDAWIERSRGRMRDYLRNEPEESALVQTIADRVMVDADGANCGADVLALRQASAARARGDVAAADTGLARAAAVHAADRARYAALDMPYREVAYDRLRALVEAGVELQPPLPTWVAYQERGIERSKVGDERGAAADFGSAIRIGPPNPALHFLRGVALLHVRDSQEAAREFEAGLKLDPDNVTLKALRSQAEALVAAKGRD